MESWQDEIIKAQISQEIGVERSMENSDTSIFLKSFEDNLISCVDRDSFDKSWSGDLQSKFPNGSWKTVNGASVFINNGKVIAGLDGFNGEIDKFFEGKGKKESGKPYKDKNGVETYEGNVSFNALSEKDKRTAYDNGIKSGEVGGSFQDFKKVFKDEEISSELISPDYNKKTPKKEPEGKLSEREQELLDAYNKDKKQFIKRNVDSAERNPKDATSTLDGWISGAKNKEYKDMLMAVKKAVEDKLSEPQRTKDSFKEKEESKDEITLGTFVDIANKSKDVKDFMKKVVAIKGVPSSVANEFQNKYGDGGKLTMEQASQNFMDAAKGKEKEVTKEIEKPEETKQEKPKAKRESKSSKANKRMHSLEGYKSSKSDADSINSYKELNKITKELDPKLMSSKDKESEVKLIEEIQENFWSPDDSDRSKELSDVVWNSNSIKESMDAINKLQRIASKTDYSVLDDKTMDKVKDGVATMLQNQINKKETERLNYKLF